MGRIRTIKPELPQSESLGRVSREARLCFILLFTLADDAGRLRGNPRMLAGLLYPYDVDASQLIDAWLKELQNQNCIECYWADGKSYIQIHNWSMHQKINRPSQPKFPAFDESSRGLAEDSVKAHGGLSEGSLNTHCGIKDQGSRIKDQGRDQGSRSTTVAKSAPASPDRAHRLPDDFKVTDEHRSWAREENLPDPDSLVAGFRDHYRANGKTMKDWDAAFRSWVRKEPKMYHAGGKGNGQYKTPKDRQRETDREAIEYLKQQAARRAAVQGDPTDS